MCALMPLSLGYLLLTRPTLATHDFLDVFGGLGRQICLGSYDFIRPAQPLGRPMLPAQLLLQLGRQYALRVLLKRPDPGF